MGAGSGNSSTSPQLGILASTSPLVFAIMGFPYLPPRVESEHLYVNFCCWMPRMSAEFALIEGS